MFHHVCEAAEDGYRTMLDRNKWAPARNLRDSRKPPSAFAHVASGGLSDPQANVLSINKGGNRTKNKGVCFNCGEKGHWKRDCPKPQSKKHEGSRKQNGNFKNNSAQSHKKCSWKFTPPAPGASETINKNGKPFYWCGKCKRWTTSHKTSSLQDKRPTKGDTVGQTNLGYLVEDPSAWCSSSLPRPCGV